MLYSGRHVRLRNQHQPCLQYRREYRLALYPLTEANSLQVVGYLAAGMVMTTSSVNFLVYQPQGAMEAAAAGHILLSIVAVCLVLHSKYFPTDHI